MRQQMRQQKGQTLIELILFIVIISIALTGSMHVFRTVLLYGGRIGHLLTASQLAEARMNLIIQKRHEPDDVTGFANLSDPCSSGSLAACTTLNAFASANGYTVTSSPNPITAAADGSKTVTVTVSGAGDATSSVRFVQ
jgi:Tfp pilus assembly protein PilE